MTTDGRRHGAAASVDPFASDMGAVPVIPEAPAAAEPPADQDRRVLLQSRITELEQRFPVYPKRLLWFLMFISLVDAADRTVLSTVFEDIRLEFGVTDAQLGLLAGAYSVVATLSVVPFGILADRVNRVKLIAFGFLPWSLAMFGTGLAPVFGVMFGARMFLGTIEATNGPSTPSLLGDYYRVEERSKVMGIYSAGALVGSTFGLAVGGVLATVFGWRSPFFVFGVLGLVCLVLTLKVLPDPERGLPDALHRANVELAELEGQSLTSETIEDPLHDEPQVDATPARSLTDLDYRTVTFRQAARQVLSTRTMWVLFAAEGLALFFMSALGIWAPTYFRRYHDLSAAAAGILVAVMSLGVVAGIVIGARLGDRYMREGRPARRLVLAVVAQLGFSVTTFLAFSLDNLLLAVPPFYLAAFCIGLPMPPLAAAGLDIFVPHLRGRANSVRSLLRVLFTAAAPILFGVLSDAHGLRPALLIGSPIMAIGALILLIGIRSYPRDMAFAQAETLRQHDLERADTTS